MRLCVLGPSRGLKFRRSFQIRRGIRASSQSRESQAKVQISLKYFGIDLDGFLVSGNCFGSVAAAAAATAAAGALARVAAAGAGVGGWVGAWGVGQRT